MPRKIKPRESRPAYSIPQKSTPQPEPQITDPIERLSQQLERSIAAQTLTTKLIAIIAEYLIAAGFVTAMAAWRITAILKNNPDSGLFAYWVIYIVLIGILTIRAREQYKELNL